jgi:hypothetical protein
LGVVCCLQSQLAALVSKCKGAEDLDYFLLEAAALVGLNTPPEAGAKVCRLTAHLRTTQLLTDPAGSNRPGRKQRAFCQARGMADQQARALAAHGGCFLLYIVRTMRQTIAAHGGLLWASHSHYSLLLFNLQGVLSELLRSLVHYKSNAALAGDSLHHGTDQQLMDVDLTRACHSPPLLRPSSGQRLRSGGSAQGNSTITCSSSSNNYSRLGSSSFRGYDDM